MHVAPVTSNQDTTVVKELKKMMKKGLIKGLTELQDDSSSKSSSSKFTKYFDFGNKSYYLHGLNTFIEKLSRSIEEECLNNDNGIWAKEFNYIVHEAAVEKINPDNDNRIRDLGHGGMTISDFLNSPIAKEANLTIAEVCVLRLYTGSMYKPFNDALREIESSLEKFRSWQTCISVLYNAILKLSCMQSKRRTVYRGADRKLKEEFFGKEDDVGGGAEISFSSTSKDPKVAISYAFRGGNQDITIFEIPLESAALGADVQWISQYPEEEEIIIPPCTYLVCKEVFPIFTQSDRSIYHVVTRADISTTRPSVANIKTLTDKQD